MLTCLHTYMLTCLTLSRNVCLVVKQQYCTCSTTFIASTMQWRYFSKILNKRNTKIMYKLMKRFAYINKLQLYSNSWHC